MLMKELEGTKIKVWSRLYRYSLVDFWNKKDRDHVYKSARQLDTCKEITMNDKLLFTYYDAKFFIDCWNSKLTHKGRVMVDDLEGLLFIQLPYDDYLEWTDPLTMDDFKLDEHGYYALTLSDPKESSIW